MTPEDTPRSLPRSLRPAYEPLPADTLDDLFERVATLTVDRAPTWRDRLRELPTPQRAALAVSASLVSVSVLTLRHGIRIDLAAAALARMVALHVAMVLVGVAAAVLSLRGLHRAPVPSALGLSVVLLLLPAAVSLVPGLVAGDATPVGWGGHVACGSGSLLVSVLSALVVLSFDRADTPVPWRAATAAATGGLFGYAAGLLTCHHVDTMHLLVGHASGGVLVAAVLVSLSTTRTP